MQKALRLLALLWLCAACDSATEVDERWADPERIQFAASLNVDLSTMNRTSSGLYWKDLRAGEGDSARVGDNVRVHFTEWLPDGTVVLDTRGQEPMEFLLGLGFVIRGFDEGVVGMQVGGIRQLVVRPSLAYGRNGRAELGIPPLATLVFQVERLTSIAH